MEEIDDVNDFIQKLEKIQLPNQMVAVFGDPLLQKLLQLNSSNTTSQRIDYWLTAFFEDQLQNPESWDTAILEMLTAILGYARLTKVRLVEHPRVITFSDATKSTFLELIPC